MLSCLIMDLDDDLFVEVSGRGVLAGVYDLAQEA